MTHLTNMCEVRIETNPVMTQVFNGGKNASYSMPMQNEQ